MRHLITAYVSGIFIATLLCRAFTAPAAAKISAEIQANDAGIYLQYLYDSCAFYYGKDCVCLAWLRYYLKKTSRNPMWP